MWQLAPAATLGAAQLITCSAVPELPEGWRYRARVQYDGTNFNGMQVQRPKPRVQTIAGVLERALSERCSQDVRVVAAGRTDAGVHARGQTIHFDLRGERVAPAELEYSLNCMMPDAVRVHSTELAPETDAAGRGWHAIYWATGKLYTYRFYAGGAMDPMQRLYRHRHCREPLDFAAMRAAADFLEGEHDFAAFANRRPSMPGYETTAKGTVRRVRRIALIDEGGGYGRAEVDLDGALYKMARRDRAEIAPPL